jgi:hypothetical protein
LRYSRPLWIWGRGSKEIAWQTRQGYKLVRGCDGVLNVGEMGIVFRTWRENRMMEERRADRGAQCRCVCVSQETQVQSSCLPDWERLNITSEAVDSGRREFFSSSLIRDGIATAIASRNSAGPLVSIVLPGVEY